MSKQYSFETRLLHNDAKVDPETGAVSIPIHHASTFHQRDIDQFGKYDYSRSLNPTREALEHAIAELEEGTQGFAFSSGMAAISTAFLLLSAGDHVLLSQDVYGGTYRMVTSVLVRLGIEYNFTDMTDLEAVRSAIRENTRVVYIETPSNPLLKVTDIEAVCRIAKETGALAFVDNTFLTPARQTPLTLGADVVLHSATKFLGGHSDVLAGLAVVKDEKLAERLYFLQNTIGAVLGAQDAWLVLRGLKTLHVRLEHAEKTAYRLAGFLESHPLVQRVFYPGLPDHPQYELQQRQAASAGAVLSFELPDEEAVRCFVSNVKIPVFAVSLGAVESILSYPAKMSHAAIPEYERKQLGISNGLLRLSVGLENADDLLADFSQALSSIPQPATKGVN